MLVIPVLRFMVSMVPPKNVSARMVTTASRAPVRNGLRLRFSSGRPRNAICDGTMGVLIDYGAVAISETGTRLLE